MATATNVLDQAADVLADTAGAISAQPHIGRRLAVALDTEGLLAGGKPTGPVRKAVVAVLVGQNQTSDQADRAARRLAEAGLLAG